MSARKRDSDKRVGSSESRMTYGEFLRMFPTNQACLDYLRDKFHPAGSTCPSCGKATKFHHIKGRSAYACQYCRGQVYPTAETIFHKSTTSLQLWFYAIYLMSSTRCGISAKQLEREIGVTYKTAHRMFKQIRSMLDQGGDGPLGSSGPVEVDETFYGRKPRFGEVKTRKEAKAWGDRKAKVLGAVERGGRIHATVIPDRSAGTIMPILRTRILPSSTVYTDEWKSYRGLGREGYTHERVNHSQNVYVSGDAHVNTIEGFWGLLKGGLRGVYHGVSTEYLQAYLDEYCWRWNHRDDPRAMFWTFLDQVTKTDASAA